MPCFAHWPAVFTTGRTRPFRPGALRCPQATNVPGKCDLPRRLSAVIALRMLGLFLILAGIHGAGARYAGLYTAGRGSGCRNLRPDPGHPAAAFRLVVRSLGPAPGAAARPGPVRRGRRGCGAGGHHGLADRRSRTAGLWSDRRRGDGSRGRRHAAAAAAAGHGHDRHRDRRFFSRFDGVVGAAGAVAGSRWPVLADGGVRPGRHGAGDDRAAHDPGGSSSPRTRRASAWVRCGCCRSAYSCCTAS